MPGLEEVTPVAGLTLSVPPGLSRGSEQGADSAVRTLNGPGISILIDRGPFVDTLTSYAGRAGAPPDQETIGGRPARVVAFADGDGARVVAAHFPGTAARADPRDRLTVVIRVDPALVPEETARAILRSLRFDGR